MTSTAKYYYSIVQFVPNIARGEYINVGAIAGSDETCEWAIRRLSNLRRARQLAGSDSLGAIWEFLEYAAAAVDRIQDDDGIGLEGRDTPSVQWLRRLSDDAQHTIQVTNPIPAVASSLENLIDTVFERLILDPAAEPRARLTKARALARLRQTFKDHNLTLGVDVLERASATASRFRDTFDFAVVNGEALQLTNAWSFQVQDQSLLASAIKSWAWMVERIRESGGLISSGNRSSIRVPKDVPVEVVLIPPMTGQDEAALEEARTAFAQLDIVPTSFEDAPRIAREAAALLSR